MRKPSWNHRKKTLWAVTGMLLFLILVVAGGMLCAQKALVSDFSAVNCPPGKNHLFGTDWLGRDMFSRTLRGLSISVLLGVGTAFASAGIALVLGILAAVNKWMDVVVSYLVDLVMGIPHILLLVLISLAVGRGLKGVVIGVMVTHWPSLARVIRGEILQLKEQPYIATARMLGKSSWRIALRHMLPNVLSQFLTGMLLLFPHAVLHESSITFLGFGLSAEQPAIGIILSESMKYLILGNWWLAVFPGTFLVVIVLMFQYMGESLKRFFDPASIHR
ncbi:MAG: ABC transporter permease [Lachnospiraceae bacterium]|jgi:peptide/nickel transport system permease protein|nr:ABC transporter permease [Lachnospiraceae bacterium]